MSLSFRYFSTSRPIRKDNAPQNDNNVSLPPHPTMYDVFDVLTTLENNENPFVIGTRNMLIKIIKERDVESFDEKAFDLMDPKNYPKEALRWISTVRYTQEYIHGKLLNLLQDLKIDEKDRVCGPLSQSDHLKQDQNKMEIHYLMVVLSNIEILKYDVFLAGFIYIIEDFNNLYGINFYTKFMTILGGFVVIAALFGLALHNYDTEAFEQFLQN
jgi:hypothetical protein